MNVSETKPQVLPDKLQPDQPSHKQFVLAALEKYERPLTRYAQRMFGSAGTDSLESARDAVQHTFMKLCQRPQQEVAHKLQPWLYSVCRNRVIDQMRCGNRTSGGWPPPMEIAESSQVDPAVLAMHSEMSERLSILIGRLSGAERETIELWSQGLKHAEIAEVLDKSPQAVRVGLHRAIKRLKADPEVQRWLERATSSEKGSNSKSRAPDRSVNGTANVAASKTQTTLHRGEQS